MSQVRKTFRAIDVGDGSDGRWAAHLRTLSPQAEGWLTDDGRTAEGALRARELFEEHMPELDTHPLIGHSTTRTIFGETGHLEASDLGPLTTSTKCR